MKVTLEQDDVTKLRGGLILWLVSLSIPVLLLVEMRFVLVGTFVDPNANQGLAVVSMVVLVLSAVYASLASRAARAGQKARVRTNAAIAFWIGLVAWLLIGIPVVNHSMNPVSHYGETFLASVGTVDVYLLFGLIGILGSWMRVKRLGDSIRNYWSIHATATVWWFMVVIWIVMYVQLYLL